MHVHLRHRISETASLELIEFSSTLFSVSYITDEGTDEDGFKQSFMNNSQEFSDYNEALAVFRKRRDSDSPFQKFTIDWEGIHNDVHYGSGRG